MSLILLADDSPHAQRMGEHILSGEGFKVECVASGEAAALRFRESNPDVVIADAQLPGLSGLDLCRYVKSTSPHVRVILTAGSLEVLDEAAAHGAGCDAILRKPFEVSQVMAAVRPLAREAGEVRRMVSAGGTVTQPDGPPADRIRVAVELAVARELPRLIDELTEKVLAALRR
jgi:DNA-binding response OmpR family regulator